MRRCRLRVPSIVVVGVVLLPSLHVTLLLLLLVLVDARKFFLVLYVLLYPEHQYVLLPHGRDILRRYLELIPRDQPPISLLWNVDLLTYQLLLERIQRFLLENFVGGVLHQARSSRLYGLLVVIAFLVLYYFAAAHRQRVGV